MAAAKLSRPSRSPAAAAAAAELRFSTIAYGPERREHAAMRAGVLIVDDHADFRESARTMLEAAGFEVVGEAADGAEAMDAEARLRPALVLLDIQLPDIDGFRLAEELSEAADPPVVVLVSSRDAEAYGDRVAASPARGFIPKFDLSGRSLAKLVG